MVKGWKNKLQLYFAREYNLERSGNQIRLLNKNKETHDCLLATHTATTHILQYLWDQIGAQSNLI